MPKLFIYPTGVKHGDHGKKKNCSFMVQVWHGIMVYFVKLEFQDSNKNIYCWSNEEQSMTLQ